MFCRHPAAFLFSTRSFTLHLSPAALPPCVFLFLSLGPLGYSFTSLHYLLFSRSEQLSLLGNESHYLDIIITFWTVSKSAFFPEMLQTLGFHLSVRASSVTISYNNYYSWAYVLVNQIASCFRVNRIGRASCMFAN